MSSVTRLDNLGHLTGVPEIYLQLISKESNRIPANLPLNGTKNPLATHMYCASLYHIFSHKHFKPMPIPFTLVPIFGLIAREGIDIKTQINTVMTGNDVEQHYKLWRYCFSTYLYTKNLCARKDLVNFLMLCVDYSFYLKNSFQRDVLMYYIFDFMTCGVTNNFDFSRILNYAKENIISNSCVEMIILFEQFKQRILPIYQGTNISSALAAFFKLAPDAWQSFSHLIQSQNYFGIEQLCFA